MISEDVMIKMERKGILIKNLNDFILCTLCGGYLIDATTLIDCLHVFCRGCILKYFENCKSGCPTCNTVYKRKNHSCFRSDPQIQSIVYKVVPGLFSKEIQRKEDFYRSTGVRASSSCSDDSVLERERDMINDPDNSISGMVGNKNQFFGPDDTVSLSLEYYQLHLDDTPINNKSDVKNDDCKKVCDRDQVKRESTTDNKSEKNDKDDKNDSNGSVAICGDNRTNDKRYLQCPAAVSMKHLQKFIRMKYALTANHRVDIIYEGEVLPTSFSLMDVAYTFKWKRTKPLRFFYRIFTPLKIQPIKIVNTTLSTGGKQLQIVPVKPTPDIRKSPDKVDKPELKEQTPLVIDKESEEQKEHLFANLQLQSKNKVQNLVEEIKTTIPVVPEPTKPNKPQSQDCVFDYVEPDKEEIKRFAEIRDREWALQKKLDESREDDYHHFSKKRKKNKHSKNESMYKKRKLHAEITNKEEDLKLKVKLTPHNGHKHKHHKNSGQVNEKTQTVGLSSKEKLLQMRQVRHKHVASEDKNVQTVASGSGMVPPINEPSSETKVTEIKRLPQQVVQSTSKEENEKKFESDPISPKTSSNDWNDRKATAAEKESTTTVSGAASTKTLRSDFSVKTSSMHNEWGNRVVKVQIERNEQTEQQAKKTFLKTFQSYSEKYQKNIEKIQNSKIEGNKLQKNQMSRPQSQLERKIANLQQHCTIETKNAPKIDKINSDNKPKIPAILQQSQSSQYPSGFTVSKIESGVKRKTDGNKEVDDKRPSLEITLIPPATPSPPAQKVNEINKTGAKRPPPATIPLERIKKSMGLKSGISIIPKLLSEKCDNIGALDLSKPNKSPDMQKSASSSTSATTTKDQMKPPSNNGFNLSISRQLSEKDTKNNMQLSNLQMLSKVATEHPNLNKSNVTKPKPQLPQLQTLRIPLVQSGKSPNLAKMPKLNEISKTQFRMMNPQIRNLRPNQNQNIRNIPNPSLLVRQQNQNRLNSINSVQNSAGDKDKATVTTSATMSATTTTSSSSTSKESAISALSVMPPVSKASEIKVGENGKDVPTV